MALPITGTPVADAYATLRDKSINLQSYCLQLQTATASGGSVAWSHVSNLLGAAFDLGAYVAALSTQAGFVAALTAYVQQMTGDSTLAVQTEFSASLAALQALIGAVVADYPKDAAGHVLDRLMAANGTISGVATTSAGLSHTLPAVAGWLGTIS